MSKPRGFRRTELRLTGTYLARRWVAQVSAFRRPSAYISWCMDKQLYGPVHRDFVEFAAGAIRRVSPLNRLVEFDLVLSSLSDSLVTFKEINERCWSRYAALAQRLLSVAVEQICNALAPLGFNEMSTAVLPPSPWLRIEEAEAVGRKLDHDVISWDDLEQPLGLEHGSLSGEVKVREDGVGPLTSERPNAGDGGAADGVHTPSTVGPNPGLAAGTGKPSHGPVQKPAPNLALGERLLEAIAAGIIKTGTLVHLPTSPIAFLKEIPVLHGSLVDEFSVRLAEYGARLSRASGDRPGRKAGGQDGRPRADKRNVNHSQLWFKISKGFASFQPQPQGEHPGFLNLRDYLAWPGRQIPGDVSSSDGVVVGTLLSWLLQELQRALMDLDRSGSADATSQSEETGESDDTTDRHDFGVAGELTNLINIDLARQARGWFDELEAIKGEAEKIKRRYTTAHAAGKLAPMLLLVERLDLLVRRARVMSTFCGATYQLASVLRLWTSGGGEKNLALFFEQQAGSSVRFRADDVKSEWLFVLKRISRVALLKSSGYLLPLFHAAAQALANELFSLSSELNEYLIWTRVESTFTDLMDDLRQELGCPLDGGEVINRSLSQLERLDKMERSMLGETHGKI